MPLFLLFTVLYYTSVLMILIRNLERARTELSLDSFLSHEHTNAIKGIATVGIVISHIAAWIKNGVGGPTRYYVVLGTTLGGIGVNLFFFASGLGNYYSVRKLKHVNDRARWFLKRILSILSVFAVCFLLTSIILYFEGYKQSLAEIVGNLVGLRMPLTKTWYLKIQILLYGFLFVSLFLKNEKIQGILLLGLSFISSYLLHRFGYTEEWWKSTLCFSLGFFTAVYKEQIIVLLNTRKQYLYWGSLIALPVFFIMACLIENFGVKVLGNTLLMINMMVVAEYFKIDDRNAGRIGVASLEIYLIHISLCGWYLRDKVPDMVGIGKVLLWTGLASFIAKIIDDKISSIIKMIKP